MWMLQELGVTRVEDVCAVLAHGPAALVPPSMKACHGGVLPTAAQGKPVDWSRRPRRLTTSQPSTPARRSPLGASTRPETTSPASPPASPSAGGRPGVRRLRDATHGRQRRWCSACRETGARDRGPNVANVVAPGQEAGDSWMPSERVQRKHGRSIRAVPAASRTATGVMAAHLLGPPGRPHVGWRDENSGDACHRGRDWS